MIPKKKYKRKCNNFSNRVQNEQKKDCVFNYQTPLLFCCHVHNLPCEKYIYILLKNIFLLLYKRVSTNYIQLDQMMIFRVVEQKYLYVLQKSGGCKERLWLYLYLKSIEKKFV